MLNKKPHYFVFSLDRQLSLKQIQTILILIISFLGFGQIPDSLDTSFGDILSHPKKITSFVLTEDVSHDQILLKFDFGSDQFESDESLDLLKESTILHISFIYSAFKVSDSFEQDALNKKRLFSLYKSIPHAFKNVQWEVIEQSDVTSRDKALAFFHGFVIDYREQTTPELIEEELSYIKASLDLLDPPAPAPKRIREPSRAKLPMSSEDYYLEIKKRNKKKRLEQTTPKLNVSYSRIFKDTTLIAVFDRNKDWEDLLITCDLTASMSPFVAQLFVWFKVNMEANKIKHFVFFNDGNTLSDTRKEIGKTGGIYFSDAQNIDSALHIAEKCMANSNGGDRPENDVEALLKGIAQYDDYTEVVLIADNWANMRDYSLMNQISKPVRIILCGTSKGINPQYLDLARSTKGSIHTLELDVLNIDSINDGELLKIREQEFKLVNDHFIEIK